MRALVSCRSNHWVCETDGTFRNTLQLRANTNAKLTRQHSEQTATRELKNALKQRGEAENDLNILNDQLLEKQNDIQKLRCIIQVLTESSKVDNNQCEMRRQILEYEHRERNLRLELLKLTSCWKTFRHI